ncbi:hypothetical protein N431DRAFT_562617 [Stipitochalara longipes BDJ]|nr:hypothetical protein N431DRAFT_562617 [Stipitochalara longipes BDJ]
MQLSKSSIEPAKVHVSGANILVRQAPYVAHDQILGRTHRVTTGYSDIGSVYSPLFERAWVFQERLLAPRTVLFHHEEMVWECIQDAWCECGEISNRTEEDDAERNKTYLKGQLKALNLIQEGITYSKEHMFTFWMDAVERYSLLSLTDESDRLPALAGLARHLSKRFSCRYLAGLWEEDLARNLLWSREPWRETWRETERRRSSGRYYTPTWSWTCLGWPTSYKTSYTSHIRYDYIQDYIFEVDARFNVVETSCEYVNPYDHFGQVKHAILTLKGAMIEVVVDTHPVLYKTTPTLLYFQNDQSLFRGDVGTVSDAHRRRSQVKFKTPAYCLLIGHSWAKVPGKESISLALVLYKTPSGGYLRMGLLALSKSQRKDWFNVAKVETIVLE